MAGAWDVIAGAFGFGGISGNDHGSSNWAAWGHEEICTMLQNTVEPADIHEAADAWRKQGRAAEDLITGLTADLRGIVTGGWRGASAGKAISALDPINQWSTAQAETTDHTTRLMDDSGSATSQTKMAMPAPVSHSWTESLLSFGAGGVPIGMVDAVMQEQRQSDAHAEAVRVMTSTYSAPLNDYRTGVPVFAQLADPTLVQPDPAPVGGPAPGAGHLGGGAGGSDGTAPGAAHAHPLPAPGPVAPSPVAPGPAGPPAASTLQGVSDSGTASSPASAGPMTPDQATRHGQHTGGQVAAAAAAAGVPVAAPIAESIARRARSGGAAMPFGAGRVAGAHGGGTGHLGDFGPRPSAAAEAVEGRMGSSLGHGSTGTGGARAGMNGMPMAPMGAGRGKDGEDSEHQRPSYLIEMDDVFTDGRKVAPAVIGEDPPAPDN